MSDLTPMDTSNAAEINAATDAVLSYTAEPDVPAFEFDESSETLPDTAVRLVGGYLDPEALAVVYDVEVRELTGLDEEAIAKTPSMGRALQVILERGTVNVGGTPCTKAMLDEMLMGDRDMVLVGIRKATYGPALEYSLVCPGCGTEQDMAVDLDKDLDLKTLENPEDRVFEVKGRRVTYEVHLPNGKVHRDLLNSPDHSVPEVTTLLLAGCIQAIDGIPASGLKTARDLPAMDRKKLADEIYKRSPGPKWGSVPRNCKECDAEVMLDLSLSALFRF